MNFNTIRLSKKGYSIKIKILYFLFFITFSPAAAIVDTILYGNGSQGPYCIGNAIIDTATLSVTFPDSMAVPRWTFIPERNVLLFSQPIDSSVPIHITYHKVFSGVPKFFSLYSKTYLDPYDTAQKNDTFFVPAAVSTGKERVNVSGYKSVGVSIGSFGQINLEQGLDVRIGGEIRPQTTVSAHLSDQGSSLDGQTREISDFDMIYLTLDDPSYRAVAGDQYVIWPFKGLLSGDKKIKGLSANYSPAKTQFSVGVFGALAGGQSTIETRQGRTGVQGPYYLSGKGERDFIMPVSGTVKVRINGQELAEGSDRDFIVDYELGTITFTPKNLITNEDLIRIEYEYKLFNYQRTLLGTTAGCAPPDSHFSVQGVFWSESDNKGHPVDLALTDAEIAALQRAGDRLPYASTAKAVHPNDVASESQVYPLYRKQTAGNDTFFVYTPFDRDHPDSVFGYYYVWFRPISSWEKGSYNIIFSDLRGPVYVFAGKDSGSYTDLSPVPAPQARRSGEIRAGIKVSGITAALNIAGQDIDHNLFSRLDDNNNQASATRFSFLAGSKDRDRRSVWLSGSHAFTSQRFDAEALSAYDRKELWDDTRLVQTQTEHQQWDAAAGATVFPGLSASLLYGQNRTDALCATDRFSPALHFAGNDRISLDYTGSFFRHFDAGEKGAGRREYGTAKFCFTGQTYGLFYRDEWRSDSLQNGSGLYEGGVSYDNVPLSLREQVSYMSRRKIRGGESWSKNTGFSVRWEQSLDHSFLPSWNLSGSSSFDRTLNYSADRATTLLIDLVSTVTPKTYGFSSHQHFRTSTELASSFIQIPVFAGKGMGTYVFDSVRKEYVPHVPGDYFMQQQEVYDQASGVHVRKTWADVTWAYEPRRRFKGILNDLSWEAALSCQEHVDADQYNPVSWVPGYTSLSSYFRSGRTDYRVHYADLSYRQDINWRPHGDSGRSSANGRLSITPTYRKIRNYIEGSLETRLETDRTVRGWTFGGALNLVSLSHKDTIGTEYSVYDRRLELFERWNPFYGASLSLLEVAGLAHKTDGFPVGFSGNRSVPFDSVFYFQIAPSFSCQPARQGSLTAIYTFSAVPLAGEVDYRMARGFLGGISHQVMINSDIRMGERLLIIGTYRGDVRKPVNASAFQPSNHVFSLEVRVFM